MSRAAALDRQAPPMIRLRDLRKRFGKLEVLKGIDLDIARSEVLVIIGPQDARFNELASSVWQSSTITPGPLAKK